MQPLLKLYKDRIAQGAITADPAQEKAALRLDAFATNWLAAAEKKPGLLNRLKSKIHAPGQGPVKGIYLYGGVGRGKSMLMDLLVESLANPRVRRVHFHAFLLEVNARLKTLRDAGGTDDFMGDVASGIAADTDLLCFDELHVNDIADAMILGTLFSELFARGVSVVATSNYPPDELYKDGLQRARFLPFIALLKKQMEIVWLDSPHDYRFRALSEKGTWFSPLNDQSWGAMNTVFETLTGHQPTHPASVDISGRNLPIERTDGRCAWVSFEVLCRENRGAVDYITLGETYETVFVDNVPRMSEDTKNEARRFMTLVDTLYDAAKVMVFRAATTPDRLYEGDTHGFEFQRTVSRLLEMQSPEWLAKVHKPHNAA